MTHFRWWLLLFVALVARPAVAERPVTFERDIQPIFTRLGCNAGACHGKARGQNNFGLSLLGFDADFDYDSLVKEARGRRVFAADPENSLLLLKAGGRVPHGGGKRLPPGTPEYERVRTWLASGTPRTPKDAPALARVSIAPTRIVAAFGHAEPLHVFAHYSDGSREDVTKLAAFQSNESGYVAVDATGRVRVGTIAGEAAIATRFGDKFAVCHVLIPLPGTVDAGLYAKLPRASYIDGHAWDKLKELGLTPSDGVNDATFHRRAFLNVIGRLPTPTETRAYLADASADKHAKLIDRLLARPEYADFWANKWADLLRPNPYHAGIKATLNYDAWIRDRFRKNVPYDVFVRELTRHRAAVSRTARRSSTATGATPPNSPRWSANSSSACGSTVRSAISTRPRNGRNGTSTASPASSAASRGRARASRPRSPAARS